MASNFSTFVMSETTIEQIRAVPEDLQLKFYNAVADFGLQGIDPEFTGMELAVWIPMRDLIINSKRQDELWRQKQRENGMKGGRPKKDAVSIETQNNPNNPSVISETQKSGGLFQKPTENPKTHNDNDNENINNNENNNENSQDWEGESAAFSVGTSKEYPKIIFDIFTEAGLPNCKGNFVTFIQRDFRLGLASIKNNNLHDADVIAACKNYAAVIALIETGKTWWSVKQPFNAFCEKNILRFIPDNFDIKEYGAGFPASSVKKKDSKWTEKETPDTDLSRSIFNFEEDKK